MKSGLCVSWCGNSQPPVRMLIIPKTPPKKNKICVTLGSGYFVTYPTLKEENGKRKSIWLPFLYGWRGAETKNINIFGYLLS